jgi:putative transposase
VLFIDALTVTIRDGQVSNRPVYSAVGVSVDGERDVLGLWSARQARAATFWCRC